jgi:hypothetical protein
LIVFALTPPPLMGQMCLFSFFSFHW